MSKVVCQAGMRAVQAIKEQASKFDTSAVKSLKDSASASASASASSSKQARRFSGSVDSSAFKRAAANEKARQAEESFRTVMYLSCWGPN